MRVQKGNTQYRINDEQKSEYLEQGFSVIDEQGNVTEKPTNITPEDAMQELEITNKELTTEKQDHEITKQQLAAANEQTQTLAAEIEVLKAKK